MDGGERRRILNGMEVVGAFYFLLMSMHFCSYSPYLATLEFFILGQKKECMILRIPKMT